MLCEYCKKKFLHKSNQKECSIKCKLLNTIQKKNDCWIWKKGKMPKGHGVIHFNGKSFYAHRASYETFIGKIPEGKLVCHNCPGGDNPACINPGHLWIGTIKDNNNDSAKKGTRKGNPGRPMTAENKEKLRIGRIGSKIGEKHHLTKFKNNDIHKIRKLSHLGYTHQEIADLYQVSRCCIKDIITRKRWAHI